MEDFPEVQLLQASVDEDDESELRMLVNRESIKYLTVDHGVYDADDMCFESTLIALLPRPFSPGSWNDARISMDTATQKPRYTHVTKARLPGISQVWHSVQVDYLNLQIGQKLRSGIYKAKPPAYGFGDVTLIIKFACFPWQIGFLEQETRAYEMIRDHNIGPKFLGHVSEDGRVIGFLLEYLEGARHAEDTDHDLVLCLEALDQLHALGIKHGDVNKHNFLIRRRDGTDQEFATLIDFATTVKCDDEIALQKERASVVMELGDTSGRGGTGPV